MSTIPDSTMATLANPGYFFTDTGLHNSWVRNNGTTQHNFCWFHCWVPINPHQLMFIQGWVHNISNQQLGNQQLVSSW